MKNQRLRASSDIFGLKTAPVLEFRLDSRARTHGKLEFAIVARELWGITNEIDGLVQGAINEG